MHICMDEIMAALLFIPGVRLAWLWLRAWRTARRVEHPAPTHLGTV